MRYKKVKEMKIDSKDFADYGKKILSVFELVKLAVEEFSDAVDKLFPEVSVNVVNENVEDTLTKDLLFSMIKKHAVEGANGMAAFYKKDVESDVDVLYLASVKDNELIEASKNKFVAIKVSDGVKKEVKEIFSSAMETEYGKLIIIR